MKFGRMDNDIIIVFAKLLALRFVNKPLITSAIFVANFLVVLSITSELATILTVNSFIKLAISLPTPFHFPVSNASLNASLILITASTNH